VHARDVPLATAVIIATALSRESGSSPGNGLRKSLGILITPRPALLKTGDSTQDKGGKNPSNNQRVEVLLKLELSSLFLILYERLK
jgi:hypothetical protein